MAPLPPGYAYVLYRFLSTLTRLKTLLLSTFVACTRLHRDKSSVFYRRGIFENLYRNLQKDYKCLQTFRSSPRAVVLTLSSYGGSAALAAEANAAFDAANSEVVAAYDAARAVANRRHMRFHAWEMQPT